MRQHPTSDRPAELSQLKKETWSVDDKSTEKSDNNGGETLVRAKADFLVFIRIPKTASTTSLSFFRRHMFSMDQLLSSTRQEMTPRVPKGYLPCIFGPSRNKHFPAPRGNGYDCTHVGYDEGLRATWLQSIHVLNHNTTLDFVLSPEQVHPTTIQEVTTTATMMEAITFVRDPFDRLRSLFDYLYSRREEELWSTQHTTRQWERLVAEDFPGWLDLLYEEKAVPNGAQYEYLADNGNVDSSIAMISGTSPVVTVLVSECLEASFRMLEHRVVLPPKAVDSFFKSRRYRHHNVSQRRNSTDDLEELRERSKTYFAKDYKFYNAAIEQFKRQALALNISLTDMDSECDI